MSFITIERAEREAAERRQMHNPLAKDVTLRDHYAGLAMQGYISARAWHPDFVLGQDFQFNAGELASDAVSVAAYKYADAMLKARKK